MRDKGARDWCKWGVRVGGGQDDDHCRETVVMRNVCVFLKEILIMYSAEGNHRGTRVKR